MSFSGNSDENFIESLDDISSDSDKNILKQKYLNIKNKEIALENEKYAFNLKIIDIFGNKWQKLQSKISRSLINKIANDIIINL